MRANDLLLAFPALLLAIMFGAVFGASTLTAMIAIGIATVPSFARVIRSGALQVMRTEYVLAARAAGRRPWPIAVRHVLPNVDQLIIVQASVSFAIAVLAEAALSFLGSARRRRRRRGAGCCRRARSCCSAPRGWRSSPASRSPSPYSGSTCSATGSATASTRGWRIADERTVLTRPRRSSTSATCRDTTLVVATCRSDRRRAGSGSG